MTGHRALIAAISGCSSSGKTTLARLLRDILPNTFILHEDDFYRPEAECGDPIPSAVMLYLTLSLDWQTPHEGWPPGLGLCRGHRHPWHGQVLGLYPQTRLVPCKSCSLINVKI